MLAPWTRAIVKALEAGPLSLKDALSIGMRHVDPARAYRVAATRGARHSRVDPVLSGAHDLVYRRIMRAVKIGAWRLDERGLLWSVRPLIGKPIPPLLRGTNNGSHRLSAEQVREIRRQSGDITEIARRYGVSRPTVSKVLKRISYVDVEDDTWMGS